MGVGGGLKTKELLVFLIGGGVATLLLLLHLLGGDHRLLVDFTLGHFAGGFHLLVFVLALLLAATPARAGVDAGLVAVALAATTRAHGRTWVGDPGSDAGLLTFEKFPAGRRKGRSKSFRQG